MHDYLAPVWQALFARHDLDTFEALWALDVTWFEEPNQRRGGWSGVARFELEDADGKRHGFFLKRQENHNTFSWRHPLRGVPTFLREYRKIMHYHACGVPSLAVAYFAVRHAPGRQRAMLITEELAGYVSLEQQIDAWQANGVPPLAVRRTYLDAVANLLQRMHAHGIQHNCFFPKHVFVRAQPDGTVAARVIDLEKSRWRPSHFLLARRDLSTLVARMGVLTVADRMRFFKRYLGESRLSTAAKRLWRHIDRLTRRKNRVPRRTERQLVHSHKPH